MYLVKLDDIKINGQPLNICSHKKDGNSCMITFDSGSPFDLWPNWADEFLAEMAYPSHKKGKACKSV